MVPASYYFQQPSQCRQSGAAPRSHNRQQQQLLQQQQQRLKLLNAAAVCIQRRFREHWKNRRNAAAARIQSWIQWYRLARHLKQIRIQVGDALDTLQRLDRRVSELEREYLSDNVDELSVLSRPLAVVADTTTSTTFKIAFGGENTRFLQLENELLKLVLAADGVDSHGHDIVRHRRKSLVGRINDILAVLDQHKLDSIDNAAAANSKQVDDGTDGEPMETDAESSKEGENSDSSEWEHVVTHNSDGGSSDDQAEDMDDMESLGSTFDCLYQQQEQEQQ